MSARRSNSRSMMRSLTLCRSPSGLRRSVTSSQFRKPARWSSPQNFERALSAVKSASVSVKPLRLPVGGAARQILVDMEAERHLRRLMLDRGEVEVRRRRDAAFRQLQHVVDRLHRAGAEDFAGRELGRHDRGGEFLEHRLPVGVQPVKNIRHEHRHQPRQRGAVIDCHLLDVGIPLPQRIGRFDQRRAKLAAEHALDFVGRRRDDRHFRHRAGPHDHRLADDANAHAFQRARGAGACA